MYERRVTHQSADDIIPIYYIEFM